MVEPNLESSGQDEVKGYNLTFKDVTNVWTFRDEKRDEVLLGMKLRDFGKGYWNGFGGKVEAGETIEEAAVRELKEESGVSLTGPLIKRAVIEFANSSKVRYKDKPAPPFRMHLFEAQGCSGELIVSDEMRPQWHKTCDIPKLFSQMWADDEIWWDAFLEPHDEAKGEFVGYFRFETQEKISAYRLFYPKTGEVICKSGDQRIVRYHGDLPEVAA